MIDLLIVKLTEHAIKALTPPKAGTFIIHYFNGIFTYSKYPTHTVYKRLNIELVFPPNTQVEFIDIEDGETWNALSVSISTVRFTRNNVHKMEYL
jgi:hypothetical protein